MGNNTQHNSYHFKIVLLGFILITFSGCHSYMLDDAQNDLRKTFANGDYTKSAELLNEFEDNQLYRSKDEVLWNLENGMVHHFEGNYDSSTVFLSKAENAIEDNYTKSVSRGFLSLIANDNKLAYDGEPYEDIYLNAFKALNFIHKKDWEGALVETRRMAYKMERLDIRIKGLAEAFAKTDTTGKVDWGSGEINFQNSAMSHYLATILYAKSGKVDDSRIEFMKLGTAFKEQAELSGYSPFDVKVMENIQNPNSYNLLITGFTGQAPIKKQVDIRLINDLTDGRYVKFSFPGIELYPTHVHRVRAIINNGETMDLHLIEEMDLVAKEVYRAKEPVIYARALLRALVKAGGTNLLQRAAEEKSDAAGMITGILSILYKEASEKADLRGWQTLPGQAWMNVVKLPPGTHTVRLEYLSSSGSVLYFDEYEVEMQQNASLELVESIYSR
jgi:hypothetical protein